MSVDKFGHFSNSNISKRNVSKNLGISTDQYNNIDIQNRKIKNLASPSEDTDAVNKIYLQTQISHSQDILRTEVSTEIKDILRTELSTEIKDIRQEVTWLKNNFKELYELILKIPANEISV